jgi:hypothetical protein
MISRISLWRKEYCRFVLISLLISYREHLFCSTNNLFLSINLTECTRPKEINVSSNGRDNQEWTILRNIGYKINKTLKTKKWPIRNPQQNGGKHMCSLYWCYIGKSTQSVRWYDNRSILWKKECVCYLRKWSTVVQYVAIYWPKLKWITWKSYKKQELLTLRRSEHMCLPPFCCGTLCVDFPI